MQLSLFELCSSCYKDNVFLVVQPQEHVSSRDVGLMRKAAEGRGPRNYEGI